MARYRDAVCRLCRRKGSKLFLKDDRCYKSVCAIDKRGAKVHGQYGFSITRRKVLQGYGEQLREKQNVKRICFVLENQFQIYFQKASRQKSIIGENFLFMLERSPDNLIYRAVFSTSRRQARQLVNHGDIKVNYRKVNIISFQVRADDVMTFKANSRKNIHVERDWNTAAPDIGI